MTDGVARSDERLACGRPPPVRASVLAWLLGGLAPCLAVMGHGSDGRHGALTITLGSLALALALRPARRLSRLNSAWVTIGIIAIMGVSSVPLVGRAPAIVASASVIVAAASVAGWRPRGWSSHHETAPVALLPLLAAQFTWYATQSMVPTMVLLIIGAVVIWLQDRGSPVLVPVDVAVRRIGAGSQQALDSAARETGVEEIREYARHLRQRAGRWLLTPKSRRDASLITALVAAFCARGGWAVVSYNEASTWATASSVDVARQFAQWDTPSLGSEATAYWSPGIGLALSPIAWLFQESASLATAARLVHVVAAVVTVALTADLARRWFSPAARKPAAWLMALAPSHVLVTGSLAPTPFVTMLYVTATWGATLIATHRTRPHRRPALIALGALIGFAVLASNAAVLLISVPALAIRSVDGDWRDAARVTGATVLGACLLLVPWTVRNGAQVGWWSPLSTASAATACESRFDNDLQSYLRGWTGSAALDAEMLASCYRGSPFDNARLRGPLALPGDVAPSGRAVEGSWARRLVREHEPVAAERLEQIPGRFFDTLSGTPGAGLNAATQGPRFQLGPLATEVLNDAANLWYYGVLGLSMAGLLLVRGARRARPLWVLPAVALVVSVLFPVGDGLALYPWFPMLAALASGCWAAVRRLPMGSVAPAEIELSPTSTTVPGP